MLGNQITMNTKGTHLLVEQLKHLLYLSPLAQVICALVLYIAIVVASFAVRYLKGDEGYKRFFVLLSLLTVSVLIEVTSNHLVVLLMSWSVSCFLLVKLMVHKKTWRAAHESGLLATKTLILGFTFILSAFGMLYVASGTFNVQHILSQPSHTPLHLYALILLVLGAMCQSGIWPFHKWVLSSLNSPTPVSAMMHAGMVNGGGILLTKFSSLYLGHSTLLMCIFVIGFLSTCLGTLWKLMQSDVKRMLACSTMGQMGFMMAQIGLGLFPAAIAHLCWHGMFKSYLFLASGSAAQEKRVRLSYPPKWIVILIGLLFGAIGSIGFMIASRKSFLLLDTNLVLIAVALIAGAQFTISMINGRSLLKLPITLLMTVVMAMAYGWSVYSIEALLEPMGMMNPQPLHLIHVISILILFASWISVICTRKHTSDQALPDWVLKLYVHALNSSQPIEKSVTASRNTYQY